jgi:hypothetical protein
MVAGKIFAARCTATAAITVQGAFAVYVSSKGQGRSLFADPVRPPEQIGMAHFIFGHCLPQESFGFFVAEEIRKAKIRGFHWR